MASDFLWNLIGSEGFRLHLPHEMLFIGRYDCEIVLKSDSVDKQHAVLNYDSIQDAFRIKDLGTSNGTYVNDTKLPQQVYITLNNEDRIKFGHDSQTFTISKLTKARDNNQKKFDDKTKTESLSSLFSPLQSKAMLTKGTTLRSSTSFVVAMSHKDAADASKAKTLQQHASDRKAKKISTVADVAKQSMISQNKHPSSVDCQATKNEPLTTNDAILLKSDDVVNNHEGGDLKKKSLKDDAVSSSVRKKMSVAVVSTKIRKQAKSSLPSDTEHSSALLVKESSSKPNKKNMESSDTNCSSEEASETGTYTIEEEKVDAKLNSKSAMHDLQQIGGATTDPSELRSNWVKEWVGKHQVTPIPVEQTNNDEDTDTMSRSGSDGQRIRRSLPAIPLSAVKAAQRAVQDQKHTNETSESEDNFQIEKRWHSSSKKRHIAEKINEQHNLIGCAIEQDVQNHPATQKRTSFEMSNPQMAMTLQALQEQFHHRPKENEPTTNDKNKMENRSRKSEGDIYASRQRHSIPNQSSSRKSFHNPSLSTNKRPVSSSRSASSSCDFSPDPPLIRSSSFIKTEPSGVVPVSQVPDVTEPARLFRSNSFIKDSPGLPKELIPRISSEITLSSAEADDFNEDSHPKINSRKGVSKNLSQKSADKSHPANLTSKYTIDNPPRLHNHQAAGSRSKPRKTKENRLDEPVLSNNNSATSKLNKESPKLPSSDLSSDNDRSTSASDKRSKKGRPHTTDVHSDAESLPLKLTRTTVLRQHKAKETEKYRLKRAASASPITTMSLPKELPQKNKLTRRKSLERLDALSKPLSRRMPRGIDAEPSDVEIYSKPPRRKSAGYINSSLRSSRDSKSSESETRTSRKLSADFPRRNLHGLRDIKRPQTAHGQTLTSPHDNHHGYGSMDCMTTSGSDDDGEVDQNNNDKAEDKTFTHNRSPPDGEMSKEIARLSHDLPSDIQLPATKSAEGNCSSLSAVTGSGPSEIESQACWKTALDSSPKAQPRKTWHSGRNALDGLMLSNVCALSSRISSVADLVAGKISVLHGGSAHVSLSKSHVPLLQQTATQEMAAIVNNLRRVEMQLLRADKILDPDCKLRDLICD